MLAVLVRMGPCQPLPWQLSEQMFPKTKDNQGHLRSFHESHYYNNNQNNHPELRTWLSYSSTLDRVFCTSCKLFGLPKAKDLLLAKHGTNSWKNLTRNLETHEHTPEHMQSEIARYLFSKSIRLDLKLQHYKNQEISDNREIVRSIVEVLILVARQNIALRGHDEKITSLNQGNFIEILKVFGRHNALLMSHLEKINSKKRNRLSFLSHHCQNVLLKIIGNQIRSSIIKDLKKASLFSIIIDTTTDVANIEQFTFVVRYIHEGKVNERLLCLEAAPDATGNGMFKTFCAISEKYEINWKTELCAQAYDGASSMQGKYSGLRTLIQNENPKAVYVWCFAHILNLVIIDTLDSTTDTKNFFGHLQSLVAFMRARKRTALFKECQKRLNVGPNAKDRLQKIKNFCNTRWTSHDRVISVIHDKYEPLKDTLKILCESTDRVTATTAQIFLKTITSFNFVLVLKLTKKIFSITTPTSCYLQSKNIDFIQALELVDKTKQELFNLRSSEKLDELVDDAKQFAVENCLPKTDFSGSRIRKKKSMPGEQTTDEVHILSTFFG